MADRSIKVILRAQVTDFSRELAKATTDLDKLVKKSGDASGAANTTMGRLAQSARLQSESWQRVGGSLVGVGAAITGVNALVAKTGIEYNTLQQKSRAALSTMLGSATEVNAQMAKLDEFARTSPFSKATFITAQQQMLAFGIEAEKVVPYLSAINEATAAAGGNNQTLSELSFIMAQISAAGKITAQDLMQFGQRGVNAAELIGSQMGKTGSQIRDDITAGTLDAGTALDALAAGMQERFEGASAGVKNTMEGAFDRVKAAWRDLSADMMSGAVGPEGGGWLVDATNGLADFLRILESLPQPVKEGAGALSAITGAVALAGGGVLLAVPKFLELKASIADLQAVSPRAASALGTLGRGATVTVGLLTGLQVVAAVSRHFRDAAPAADDYAAALKRVASAADDVAVSSAIDDLFGGVSSAMIGNTDDLREAMGVISQYQGDVIGNLLNMNDGFEDAVSRFAQLDAQLASADTEVAAQAFDYVRRTAEEAGWSVEDLAKRFPEYSAALNLAAAEAGLGALTTEQLVAAMSGLASPLDTAALSAERWSEAVKTYHTEGRGAAETSEAIAERLQAEAEAAGVAEQEWVEYLNTLAGGSQTFTNLGAAMDVFADGAVDSLDKYLAALEEQIEAQNAWEANMLTLSGRASQGLIDHLAQMGAEGAPLVAALVDATDAELSRMEAAFAESGSQSSMEWAEGLADGAAVWAALGRKMGDDVVREAAAEVASGKSTLQGIIDRYDLQATIDANADPAIRAAQAALSRIQGMTATMSVSARVQVYHANGLNAPVATGGYMADVAAANGLAGGGMAKTFHYGGEVFGPGTTTSDDVPARLSRREFVQRAAAVDYYGTDVMYALNSKRIPRDYFRALGFAEGGTPAHTYQPHRAVTATSATLGSTVNVGDIHVHVQGGTSEQMLDDFARQLPGVIAGSRRP